MQSQRNGIGGWLALGNGGEVLVELEIERGACSTFFLLPLLDLL
jgi:hypothetical protein